MSRRFLILMSLAGALLAKMPRPVAAVPILDINNKNIDLRKFRGHTVVLMIFSTVCEECIRTIGIMNNLQKDFGPKGLQVVAAAGDTNAKYMVGPFIQRYRPIFPVGYIDQESIIKVAEVPAGMRPVVPIILFIDRWGVVREQFYGNDPVVKSGEASLRPMVRGMLAVSPAGGASK